MGESPRGRSYELDPGIDGLALTIPFPASHRDRDLRAGAAGGGRLEADTVFAPLHQEALRLAGEVKEDVYAAGSTIG